MRRLLVVCVCGGLMMSLASCTGSPAREGDKAYKESKKVEGNARRELEKKAFMNYKRAVEKHPDKITPRLRNRFVEMALVRGYLILREGGYNYEAVPLLREEIDKYWAPDIADSLKNLYASFMVELADSALQHSSISKAVNDLNRAITVAANKEKFETAKSDRVSGLVEEYYVMGKAELEQGRETKNQESLVRAEFYAKMVLALDSTHEGAQKLLSEAYRENIDALSVYKRVIDPPPDTSLFREINEYDIFLAVAAQKPRARNHLLKVSMWYYSYNPQRLKPKSFKLVDVNGTEYTALPSSKVAPEFLDLEHETELTLVFPKPKARIQKLVYKNPPHYTEKFFF